LFSSSLTEIAMDSGYREPAFLELAGNSPRAALGSGEDHGQAAFLDL